MELICPKCHGAMRTYERNGVHVDQCTECRGIFLDRGELEALIDAEAAWNARQQAPAQPAPAAPAAPAAPTAQAGGLGAMVEQVLQTTRSSGHSQQPTHGYPHRKKKKSFLGELFD